MFNELIQHLDCCVCLEQKPANYVLACGHSFCHDCIEGLKRDNTRVVTCPTCRAINITKSQVFHNYKMDAIVDYLKENSFDSFVCQCGEYTSKAYAFKCNDCHSDMACGRCMHLGHKSHDTVHLRLPLKSDVKTALQIDSGDKLETVKMLFDNFYNEVKSRLEEIKKLEETALQIVDLDFPGLDAIVRQRNEKLIPVEKDIKKAANFFKYAFRKQQSKSPQKVYRRSPRISNASQASSSQSSWGSS